MPTTPLEATWAINAPTHVVVGDVTDHRGKPIDLRRLIQRRWGWPKKSATRAAEYLTRSNDGEDLGFRLPVKGPDRSALQQEILAEVPGVMDDLMEGVANRAQRDARTADRPVSQVTIALVRDSEFGPVLTTHEDDGLVTSLVHAVATWLGLTADEVRKRMDFSSDGAPGAYRMMVWDE